MRDVVRSRWFEFTEPLEGGVASFYADMRQTPEHPNGIVTIAYGNAIFTPSEAAALPMVHPDGTPATDAEKIAAWHTVHADPVARVHGWQYAARLSPLRLPREGMRALALARLESNEAALKSKLSECWDDLEACAQLALHSLAWAVGVHSPYPRLFQDVRDGDYEAAEVEIHMNEWTPEGTLNRGLIPRNVANKILMRNAARVRDFHLDPDLLDWTHVLGVSDAVTVPALDNPASSPTVHPMPDTVADFLARDPDECICKENDGRNGAPLCPVHDV